MTSTPTLPVIDHAVRQLEAVGETISIVVTLQPTSPLRTAAQIDEAVSLLESSGARSAVAVAALGLPASILGAVVDGRFRAMPWAGPTSDDRQRPRVYGSPGPSTSRGAGSWLRGGCSTTPPPRSSPRAPPPSTSTISRACAPPVGRSPAETDRHELAGRLGAPIRLLVVTGTRADFGLWAPVLAAGAMVNAAATLGRVTVGTGAQVGIGAVVRKKCTIGDRVHVAVGAVVVRDVPAGTRVAGVPARPMDSHSASQEDA